MFLIKKVRKWLGEDGINHFREYKNKYGTVSPVYMEGTIPHPVHFRDGMQVRNFLRTLPECSTWTQEELDNKWAQVIDCAICSVEDCES
jgi:hypothetical protein